MNIVLLRRSLFIAAFGLLGLASCKESPLSVDTPRDVTPVGSSRMDADFSIEHITTGMPFQNRPQPQNWTSSISGQVDTVANPDRIWFQMQGRLGQPSRVKGPTVDRFSIRLDSMATGYEQMNSYGRYGQASFHVRHSDIFGMPVEREITLNDPLAECVVNLRNEGRGQLRGNMNFRYAWDTSFVADIRDSIFERLNPMGYGVSQEQVDPYDPFKIRVIMWLEIALDASFQVRY